MGGRKRSVYLRLVPTLLTVIGTQLAGGNAPFTLPANTCSCRWPHQLLNPSVSLTSLPIQRTEDGVLEIPLGSPPPKGSLDYIVMSKDWQAHKGNMVRPAGWREEHACTVSLVDAWSYIFSFLPVIQGSVLVMQRRTST